MRRWLVMIAFSLLIAVTFAACAAPMEPGIHIEDAWVRPAPMAGGTGAAFMKIANGGPGDDALIGMRVDFDESVEVHQSVHSDGMASMHMIDAIDLPAGESVSLEPGGFHAMLINIADPLLPGDTVTLTLIFENAGEMEITAEVRAE